MAVGKGSILRAGNANAAAKAEDMTVKLPDTVTKVPLDALRSVPGTWGIVEVDETQVTRLKESFKEFGMLVPVLVYKNKKQELFVVKGNHRTAAARAAGLSEVPVSFVEASTDARAKEIYKELHSFDKISGNKKEYEVVSSITTNMPSYLL